MAITDDRFRNVLTGEVTQAAANALQFAEMTTGASLGTRLGLIIDQISYYPSAAALRELVANNDRMMMAITTSDQVTDLEDEADSRILHVSQITSIVVGAVTSLTHSMTPLDYDFTPPLIVAAPRLHLAFDTNNFAAAQTCRVRIAYRFISLSPQEYLEVAETFLHQ